MYICVATIDTDYSLSEVTEKVDTDEDILRKLGVNKVIGGEEHISHLF